VIDTLVMTTSTGGANAYDEGTQTEVRDAYFEILSMMKQGESPFAWLQFLSQKLDDIQGAIKVREEGQDQPVLTQSSSTESHASVLNSRFWFDMYSRLKQEVARERSEFLD
jgi:hypothetical protein